LPDVVSATSSPAQIELSELLANDLDPEGDALAIVAVSPRSASGGTVEISSPTVTYTPPDGFLGRDFFKMEEFRKSRANVERLATLSTRYQDMLGKIDAEIEKRDNAISEVFASYAEELQKLGEFSPSYTDEALKTLRDSKLTRRAQVGLEVVEMHLEQYRKLRRVDGDAWKADYKEFFKDLGD